MQNIKLEEMLDMLEDLVNIDSGSYDKDGIDKVGSKLKKLYKDLGFRIRETEHDTFGNCLVLKHEKAQNPKILILAHMDTVYTKGSVAKRPFAIEGNYAYGPVIIDMKTSLVMVYYIMKTLIESEEDSYK